MANKREKWAPSSHAYREATLAMLRVLTHQSFNGTDAAVRKFEEALALAKVTFREVSDQGADNISTSGLNGRAAARAEVLAARVLQTIDETDQAARVVEKAFSRFAKQHRH